MPGFTYKSYNFTEKDPIIDEIRSTIKDCGANYKWIEEHSGVTTATLYNWFYGKTRRPQAASVNAVLRAMGYKLGVVELKKNSIIQIVPPLTQDAKHPVSVRHVIQMAKYKKKG